MISLLAKWFIKAPPTSDDARARQLYGTLCGVVGICLNLLLVAGKLVAGALSGSIAITADGLNNLSDAASSLITLVGFRVSRQRPDEGHPFGHGRIEYIAGLLVSIVILMMGVELLRGSVGKIANPEPVTFSWLAIGILAASIGVKAYMALYNRAIGRKIDSAAMAATAIDSLGDVAATTVVLVAMLVGHFTSLQIDGWCGLLVSLVILYGGVMSLRDTVNLLMGQPPTPEYIQRIRGIVLAHPEILGVHDLMVHDYGPGRRIITLHAEVSAGDDMLAAHDAIDNVEKELQETLGCNALIHMDPIETDNALADATKARVAEVIKGLDERATIHDFRMVSGPTHTNLIFDLSVPFDVRLGEAEIKRRVAHMIHALDATFFAVVTVDRVGEGML